jgi:hypothetical protein
VPSACRNLHTDGHKGKLVITWLHLTYKDWKLKLETVINKTDKLRYTVSIDVGNHWQIDDFIPDDIGLVRIDRQPRDYDFDRGEFYHELRQAFVRMPYGASQAHAAKLFLSMAGVPFREFSLRGYGQGDWCDVIVYGRDLTADNMAAYAHTLKSWLFGDIYDITRQELQTWQNIETAEIKTEWANVETFGGFMFSDDYTIDQAIVDSFGDN